MNNITPLPETKFIADAQHDIFKTQEKNAAKKKLINKIGRVAYLIFSVIIFPVGIKRLIGYFAAKYIAPAQFLPATYKCNITKQKSEKETKRLTGWDQAREKFLKENNAEQITARTADGIDLDLLSIKANEPAEDQKWIVYFLGNSSCYEKKLRLLKEISQQTGANLLTGNYRGVMRSKGRAKSSKDLIMDGETMVQYLLRKGVAPENILIHGMSLGGAVAAQVAALHQKKGHEMHLCAERSFSSVKDLAKSRFGWPLGILAGKLADAADWQFNSLKSYQQIRGNKFTIYTREDSTIKYDASLYKKLKESQMTSQDRRLKKERNQAKKRGTPLAKVYDKGYKPENAIKITLDQNAVSQQLEKSLDHVRKKWGAINHNFPILHLEDPMKRYVKNVKAALNLL